jgi:hypothetical protein
MRTLRRFALVGTLMLVSAAHIGSPDVWFDGAAGPYRVLVHVQPPPVVPGIAVVNVQVTDPTVTRVTALVNVFDATGAAPPPDVAAPIPARPTWYSTRLWVMEGGSNGVTVGVSGSRGSGSVVVPLTALPTRRLAFGGVLAVLLPVAGVILALGLFTIVGAAVREGVLPPGASPDAQRRRRARFAMARAVLVVALAIVGTAAWWRAEDSSFARRLYRPMPVRTAIDTSAGQLHFTITDSIWIHRNDVAWLRARRIPALNDLALIEDHGKLVHLFLISSDGHSAFAHLHPATTDSVTFTAPLPNVPAGTYSLFADIVHSSGLAQTLTSTVSVPATRRMIDSSQLDADDSWAVGHTGTESAPGSPTRSVLDDGTVLTWTRPATSPLVAGEEADLRFVAVPPPGDTASLEPFLGMGGHAVVVRDDAKVFIHLHPLGTISVAAQARLTASSPGAASHPMSMASGAPDSLYFPYAFPQPGNYTVWVQVKRKGRVMTGSFPAEVRARGRDSAAAP